MVAGLVIGGFSFYTKSRADHEYAPKILSFNQVPKTSTRPAGMQVTFETTEAFRRWSAGEVNGWDYRVRDESGRTFGVADGDPKDRKRTVFFPLGYWKPVVNPRLEIWTVDGLVTSAPLPPFPAPVQKSFALDPHPRLRAYPVSSDTLVGELGPTMRGSSALRFEPTVPLADKETWTIEVLETSSGDHPKGIPTGLGGPLGNTPTVEVNPDAINHAVMIQPDWVLHFPYADETKALRLRVTRWVPRSASETIVIPGLRLGSNFGQTVLLGSAPEVKNGLGLNIRLEPLILPTLPPKTKTKDGLFVHRQLFVESAPHTGQGSKATELKLLSPRPEALGIRGIDFGWNVPHETPSPASPNGSANVSSIAQLMAKGEPNGTPVTTPFSAVFSVKKNWLQSLEVFETTIAVNQGR